MHDAPPIHGVGVTRTRFLGSEPYGAEDYAPSTLFDGDGGEDTTEVPPPLNPHTAVPAALAVEEEIRLRLCELKANGGRGVGVSEADMNNILRIVKLAATGAPDPTRLFANCDELSRQLLELVAAHPEQNWFVSEVTAPSFPQLRPVKVVHRRLEDVLKALVNALPIRWGFWDYDVTKGGHRIYAHPCGAVFFEEVCKLLAGTGISPLLVQLWSDHAELTKRGNKSYYPLNCVVLPVPFEDYRDQWSTSAVAFLPSVERNDLPSAMSDREYFLYKAEISAACMGRVLLPVLSSSHAFACIDHTGTTRSVMAVLHSWVADFEEQLALAALIAQTGCAMCDVPYGPELFPNGDKFEPRSAARCKHALAAMQHAWKAQRLTEFDSLRSHNRLQGTPSILLKLYQEGLASRLAAHGGPLDGFVPGSVMPQDTLHVFDEGWSKRILHAYRHHLDALHGKATGTWLTDTLAMRFEIMLDMAFIERTKWPNPWRVFRGSGKKDSEGCSGFQACEMRAVLQLLPTLLPGILGEKQQDGSWKPCDTEDDYFTALICAYNHYYMELKRYNRPPGHTEQTLMHLEHLGSQVLRIVSAHFLDDQKSGFALPKSHQGFGPHVQESIRWLGEQKWLSTEWGENSVKTGHTSYEATNKHTRTVEEQMAAHMARRVASRSAFNAAGLKAASDGLGTRRNAGREAVKTGSNTLALEVVHRVRVAEFRAKPLPAALAGRLGMAEFPDALRRCVGRDEVWVHLVNSAALCARMSHHPDEYDRTSLNTVYASMMFMGRRRLSFVALEGHTDDGVAQEWIAQLLLLFRLTDGSAFAYVQFLVADESRAGRGPLFATPGCAPLVWERLLPSSTYSYAVTPLETLIRREFVVPDLSSVFAPRGRRRELREAARQRRAATRRHSRLEDSDSSEESADEPDSDDASGDDDEGAGARVRDDVATNVTEDGAAKRWPMWTRTPYVWGWDNAGK